MRILYVCTANICRSASAQRLLSVAVSSYNSQASGGSVIEVASAGVAAIEGLPGCELAPALQPDAWAAHRSRRLTVEHLEWADLILVATREHRRAAVQMCPAARERTYTILQAGQIADWLCVPAGHIEVARERLHEPLPAWVAGLDPMDPRSRVPALPDTQEERWSWLVTEMGAARGLAPSPAASLQQQAPKRGGWWRRGAETLQSVPDPLDLPDPHVEGMELHGSVALQLGQATEQLLRALRQIQLEP